MLSLSTKSKTLEYYLCWVIITSLEKTTAFIRKGGKIIPLSLSSARCKYLYIDKLAPCTKANTLKTKYFVNMKIICIFEHKIYAEVHRSKVDK